MNGREWEETIEKLVISYVKEYREEKGLPNLWRTPLVGYADANDPYIQRLPELVADVHKLPQDFMKNPKVVISYFIPFTKELERTNVGIEDHSASEEWADAYKATNAMMASLNEYLVEKIQELGGRAAVTEGVGMLYDILKSNWSQRHIAYAAGLGTFGINNMLITKEGCCGRYNSIVADIPVQQKERPTEENCLYKSKEICKKCVKNCFSGALTTEGFDRRKCFETCEKNMAVYGVDVCGKCVTDIPCAFTAP